MNASNLHIAVTGLHRGDNPQPGAGIIRSLRRRFPNIRITGLVYDAMESGIYAEDGPDDVHLLPYPTTGAAALFERLDAIRAQSPFSILIPTLDAEIEIYAHLEKEFAARNIRLLLPQPAVLRRRAKACLPALADTCNIAVPETRIARDYGEALGAATEIGYPLVVKGPFYDARIVHHPAQFSAAVSEVFAEWGRPVILQRFVSGTEVNVLGLGDGRGGWHGHCAIRKTRLSDKGKGTGAVTIEDPRLTNLCARLIRELHWPGPFEIELIREETSGDYLLLEINPRFPAWIDFPAMLGANFAAALVEQIATGRVTEPLPTPRPGTFYLRHQVEVIGDLTRYAALLNDSPIEPGIATSEAAAAVPGDGRSRNQTPSPGGPDNSLSGWPQATGGNQNTGEAVDEASSVNTEHSSAASCSLREPGQQVVRATRNLSSI